MSVRISIIEDDEPLRRIFTSWLRRAPDLQLVYLAEKVLNCHDLLVRTSNSRTGPESK